MAVGLSGGAVIVAGGNNFSAPILQGGSKIFLDDIYVCTDSTGLEWRHTGKMPNRRANAASVTVNDGVLIMGGTDGVSISDEVTFVTWDVAAQCIKIDDSFPQLPYPVEYLSAACVDNTVYVAGGKSTDGMPQHNFWRLRLGDTLDRQVVQWEELPPWPGPMRAGSILLGQPDDDGGTVYLFGGKSEKYLDDAYRYSCATGDWHALSLLPRSAYLSHAVALSPGQLGLFSGSDGHDADKAIAMQDEYDMVDDAYIYHIAEDRWVRIGDIPIGVAGAGVTKRENKIWLIGGELRPGVRTNSIQIGEMTE